MKKFEGYCCSNKETQKVKPVPNVLAPFQAREIHELIRNIERNIRPKIYRGIMISPIDNAPFLAAEYEHDGWIWNSVLSDHFVLKHRVRPSDDFLKYIGWLK
jgi:hypothetical protein